MIIATETNTRQAGDTDKETVTMMTDNEVDVQQPGGTADTTKTMRTDKETNVVISQANHKESGTGGKIETKVADNELDVSTKITDRQASENDIDMEENEPDVASSKIDHEAIDREIVMTDNETGVATNPVGQVADKEDRSHTHRK